LIPINRFNMSLPPDPNDVPPAEKGFSAGGFFGL